MGLPSQATGSLKVAVTGCVGCRVSDTATAAGAASGVTVITPGVSQACQAQQHRRVGGQR